jgi:hypothetical protein
MVGSVSKTLTALGILVLAQADRISLTQSINEYLPIPYYRYDNVNVLELLSHTSSIQKHWPKFGILFLANDEADLKATCNVSLDPPYHHMCGDPNHPGIHPRSAYFTYFTGSTNLSGVCPVHAAGSCGRVTAMWVRIRRW